MKKQVKHDSCVDVVYGILSLFEGRREWYGREVMSQIGSFIVSSFKLGLNPLPHLRKIFFGWTVTLKKGHRSTEKEYGLHRESKGRSLMVSVWWNHTDVGGHEWHVLVTRPRMTLLRVEQNSHEEWEFKCFDGEDWSEGEIALPLENVDGLGTTGYQTEAICPDGEIHRILVEFKPCA